MVKHSVLFRCHIVKEKINADSKVTGMIASNYIKSIKLGHISWSRKISF